MGMVPVVELTRKDVDFRGPAPRESFLKRISQKLVRDDDPNNPGFAVIPNTRDALLNQRQTGRFPYHFMRRLNDYWSANNSNLVDLQKCIDLPVSEEVEYYKRVRRSVMEIDIDGVASDKYFHMDVFHHIWVVLCYRPTKNVRGGTPQFLDTLRLRRETGLSFDDVAEMTTSERWNPGSELYHPKERFSVIRPGMTQQLQQFVTKVSGLQHDKYPLIVFSNRLVDGLMHGATKVAKRDASVKKMLRPLSYFAIGYE